jgi:predicted ArsR family transcriptional regulator
LQAADQGLGVRELAADVGLHTNTVRMHLDRLVAEGLVRRQTQDRREPGRPPLTFSAVASGFHGDRRAYRLLAEMLASFVAEKVPDSRTAAIETGRMWGHFLTERPGPYRRADRQRSLDVLNTILDDIGFAPEIVQTDDRQEVWLRHCPFLEVATEYREVVCSIHLGLIQGVLSETRGPLTADELRPLVEPSLCIARLAPVDDGSSSGGMDPAAGELGQGNL